ncbi:hypothetical protein IWX50DRAFT_276632 [Phyllosticta citricarpa]
MPSYTGNGRKDRRVKLVRSQPHTLLDTANIMKRPTNEEAAFLVCFTDSLQFLVIAIGQDDLVGGLWRLDVSFQARRVEHAGHHLHLVAVVGRVEALARRRARLSKNGDEPCDADARRLRAATVEGFVIRVAREARDADEVRAGLMPVILSRRCVCLLLHLLQWTYLVTCLCSCQIFLFTLLSFLFDETYFSLDLPIPLAHVQKSVLPPGPPHQDSQNLSPSLHDNGTMPPLKGTVAAATMSVRGLSFGAGETLSLCRNGLVSRTGCPCTSTRRTRRIKK